MMNVIEINHVKKSFKNFSMNDITLNLPKGYLIGLIGANGAGKTTLIKLLMGLYLCDEGDISIFGMDIQKDGVKVRDKIGCAFDSPKYYDFSLNKIKKIIAPFYSSWDEEAFQKYLVKFKLKKSLKFKKLSRGMKIKFSLAIALSHNAELLILDEPTSGLDPIFRVELLHILQDIMLSENCSILFSSHITDDIEKIADYVIYIKDGDIVLYDEKNNIMANFLLIKGDDSKIPDSIKEIMISGKETKYNYEALIPKNHTIKKSWKVEEQPTLEQIMLYHEMRSD